MPRKKKRSRELTTDEAMKKLFPKDAVKEVRKVAREQEKRSINKEST